MDCIIELHPWDVAEEGARQTIERIASLGVRGVSLTAIWPPRGVFRPRAPSGRLHVPERAEAHFRPDAGRWNDKGLRPHPAESMQIEDYFQTLPELARAEGLSVEARFVLLPYTPPPPPAFQRTDRPAARPYPVERLYARNAFGDRLPGYLCPSYDETREYFAGLVAEVARYEISAVALESFGFPSYDFAPLHGARMLGASAAASFLAGVCFCEKCVERGEAAGIETSPLAWRVRNFLDRVLSGSPTCELPSAQTPDDLAEIDEQLPVYLRMRCEVVGSLARDIRAATRPEVGLAAAESWHEGADAESLADAADELRLSGAGDVSELVLGVSVAREKAAGRAEISARLDPEASRSPGAEAFLEMAAVAKDLELRNLVISSFGELAPAHLEWIPQALRA